MLCSVHEQIKQTNEKLEMLCSVHEQIKQTNDKLEMLCSVHEQIKQTNEKLDKHIKKMKKTLLVGSVSGTSKGSLNAPRFPAVSTILTLK